MTPLLVLRSLSKLIFKLPFRQPRYGPRTSLCRTKGTAEAVMISQRLLHRSLVDSFAQSLLRSPQCTWKSHKISIRSFNAARTLYQQKVTNVAATNSKPPQVSILGKKQPEALSEVLLSNKEQRKADWVIMKEMAKYLWPKVSCR